MTIRDRRPVLIIVFVAIFCAHDTVLSAPARPLKRARQAESPKRARPPVWSRDVLDTFFEDARDKLEGQRPNYDRLANSHTAPTAVPASAGRNANGATKFAWSNLIDADAIETEIKRLSQSVNGFVTTPSAFKGGLYKAARRDFSTLAVLFAVTGDYDGQVRWQDSAAGLRELFARAGYNAKVGTDQTFKEAKLRQQDLADLIRGSRPQVPKAEAEVDWGRVADLPPLMQRIKIAHEERLTKWLADRNSFRRKRDDVRHEAQLVAMLAETISREGFDYWDEEEYSSYVRELRQAASDVAAAADQENFNAARESIGRATKACVSCHADYRG